MELMAASKQWAERPDDERFSSLAELHGFCQAQHQGSAVARVPYAGLEARDRDGAVILANKGNGAERLLTHWSFGQLSARAGAPAAYLRQLPAELAARCLNTGLARRDEDGDTAQVLVHTNGHKTIRALTSLDYSRIWNDEVTGRLQGLAEYGWRVPPARPARKHQKGTRPATAADVLPDQGNFGLSVKVGDLIAPAGLYASDHDMFAFLVNESRRLMIPGGSSLGLARGFFAWNSEVGDLSFGVCAFLYNHVCGNHIIWGASNVHELRVRHVGGARTYAFHQLRVELRQYAERAATEDEARIKAAVSYSFGKTKAEVLDAVFKLKISGLTREITTAAYDSTVMHRDTDGDPTTAWGLAQGITRVSQDQAHGDRRLAIDRAAGKLLDVVA
jgi:hypothetical protein